VRYGLGLVAAALSVVAGTDLFGSSATKAAGLLGGFAAAALALLAPGETAEQHRAAAARWEGLDRRATTFAEAHIPSGEDTAQLLQGLDDLVEEANTIGRDSPNIARWSYAWATSRAHKNRPAPAKTVSRPNVD